MFELQLVVTEKCNLSCTYCYMNKRPSDMTINTFNKFYEDFLPIILNDYKQTDFKICFFGGEPLLNWNLVEYILNKTKDDIRCKSKVLVTNGILLDENKEKVLKEFNVLISVSFDGLGNKECRPLSNGESSLDYYLKETYVKNYLRRTCGSKVMIPPKKSYTLLENYNWFFDHGIYSPDFTIVRDFWTEEEVSKFKEEIKDLTEEVIKRIKDGKRTLPGFYKLAILDLIYGESYGKRKFGCFSGRYGIALMPNNKVYPCARFGSNCSYILYDCNNNIKNDFNIEEIKNLSKTYEYDKCKKCEIFNYCNMGCLFSQIKNNKEPLDCVCKLYFIIYEEAIRIVEELKNNAMFKDMLINSIKEVN